ncbi:phosphotransferase [Streptomyces dysideae]|uniref:Phosphotransferase n=1 Tax=Streptomyces dysideae TaxID=909626 RepID=A0A101UV33_9ACTN|nr:phosphotransferase [Streptomyces dysideae]KUO17428.1 phosphotransferase [Streptomyces dysideae]
MRQDAPTVVDRGQYPDATTPWERDAWRDAALGWAADELAAHGLRVTGRRSVRLRPWSVLVRLSVEGDGRPSGGGNGRVHDTVWFKANPPASAFEAGLTWALSRWVPEHVLTPLAVDADRSWSLLPDGGELFRDVLDRGPTDPHAWEEPLRRYASLQRALVPYADEIELLGVPGARTATLPEVFDRAVAANTVLSGADRERLRALRPRLADWCAELAAVGVPDSLDHSDLHEGQLFHPVPGRFTFFDWGDAAVTHPLCSFLVIGRTARERYGPGVLPRLRDAYLEPWTGDGRTPADLRRAVPLAWRLGALCRADSWGRLFPEAAGAAGAGAEASAHWLLQLLEQPPL